MNGWEFFTPQEGQWYRWRLNGGAAYLCRTGTTWRTAVRTKTREELDPLFDGPEPVESGPDSEPAVVVSAGDSVALRPTMINKPVVIEATNGVQVLKNQEVDFTVNLPVSVHFELPGGETLCRLNTFYLPKTWFGDTTTGILCFSWPQRLVPSTDAGVEPLEYYGSMLRCRIRIRNFAKATLELKRFAVYTEMLSIWERHGVLTSDTVVLEGLADGSLKMGVMEDEDARSGEPLHRAQAGQTDLLIKRGVSFLRSITGIT